MGNWVLYKLDFPPITSTERETARVCCLVQTTKKNPDGEKEKVSLKLSFSRFPPEDSGYMSLKTGQRKLEENKTGSKVGASIRCVSGV